MWGNPFPARGEEKEMNQAEIQKKFLTEAVERGFLGATAGVAGGAVFGVWMAQNGVLAAIAGMMGSGSSLLGLVIHLIISAGIGASFGMLFSRLAESVATSTLWGLVYGFVWWFLGPLTMMPVMMGMGPQWTASMVAATIPSLIWHLVFGGILGIAYEALRRERLTALLPRS